MDDILSDFLESGFDFKGRSKKILVKELFPGYTWEVELDRCSWDDPDSIIFRLYSRKFSQVMSMLFQDESSLADCYSPRVLIKDNSGCLGMATVGRYEDDEGDGEVKLHSAAIYIKHQDFLGKLCKVSSPEELYDFLYKDIGGKFVALMEGVWILMLLYKERGFEDADIVWEINEGPMAKPKLSNKKIDIDIVNHFSQIYENCS